MVLSKKGTLKDGICRFAESCGVKKLPLRFSFRYRTKKIPNTSTRSASSRVLLDAKNVKEFETMPVFDSILTKLSQVMNGQINNQTNKQTGKQTNKHEQFTS